jgi:hypothetical protein
MNQILINLKSILQIEAYNEKFQFEKALNQLRGHIDELDLVPGVLLHYKIAGNIDGVFVFKNTLQGEVIPILCYIHSINKSASKEDEKYEIILETRLPCIVGFFHGKQKPLVEDLCRDFVAELNRLDPNNNGHETSGRKFTCSLYCMSCDSPMR